MEINQEEDSEIRSALEEFQESIYNSNLSVEYNQMLKEKLSFVREKIIANKKNQSQVDNVFNNIPISNSQISLSQIIDKDELNSSINQENQTNLYPSSSKFTPTL
jgi:hypothetical protein